MLKNIALINSTPPKAYADNFMKSMEGLNGR